MICYRCREEVGHASRCPHCGTGLKVYKKAIAASNVYYNDGLRKAEVRNLSGAIISLRTSLKFDKYNINARNLLGLVYYEVGEVVDALSEWVISKSYQPKDNLATKYLDAIQANRAQLESVNQTIKKYNQALLYCKQDSRDLAIIQLKKVLALNPKLVKGHQLLALLYLQENKLEQAKRSLRSAGKIDTDNTLTLRYLKEVNQRIRESARNKKPKEDDLISYQSGNETIIMPKRFKESSVGSTLASIVIGLIVGVAVTAFLIVPSVKNQVKSDMKAELLTANEAVSTHTQTIADLEEQIADLEKQLSSAQTENQQKPEEIASYEHLLEAYAASLEEDVLTAGSALEQVKTEHLNDAAKTIYDEIMLVVNEEYMAQLYDEGYDAYKDYSYELAIERLQKLVDLDADYKSGNAVYYLAQSYRKNEDMDNARKYYQYVLDNYPGTERAKTAENYVDAIN